MAKFHETSQFNKYAEKPWINKLQEFNIRHVEQLASLLASPSGQIAFGNLNIDVDLDNICTLTNDYLAKTYRGSVSLSAPYGSGTGFSLLTSTHHPLGFSTEIGPIEFNGLLPSELLQPIDETDSSSPIKDTDGGEPQNHLILDNLPEARNQHYRGTCVAFTVTAMIEAFILAGHAGKWTRSIHFSEQYLYYRTKQNDPDQTVDGTEFEYALTALREFGVCSESFLPYREHHDWGQANLFRDPSYLIGYLDKMAKLNRISGCRHLNNARSVNEIKQALNENYAVGSGVLIFQDAWYNGFTEQQGEIQLPVTTGDDNGNVRVLDTCVGGHAIAIYGYEDNPKNTNVGRPGGGFFIFRNSWGQGWARGNNTVNEQGYGQLPYAYIEKYGLDACIITGIHQNKTSNNKAKKNSG